MEDILLHERQGSLIIDHSTIAPSFLVQDLLSENRRVLKEAAPRSLVINSHAHEQGFEPVGPHLIPNAYPVELRDNVEGNPAEVLDRLRLLIHSQYKRYSAVILALELHQFHGRTLEDILGLCELLSHGTVVALEYTLRDVPPAEGWQFVPSIQERKLQERYGFETWYRRHAVFTPESFHEAMQQAPWRSYAGVNTSKHRSMGVASTVLTDSEMRLMVANAFNGQI